MGNHEHASSDTFLLTKLVSIKRETIGNLKNGRYNPSFKLALNIAKVFDTTMEDIFTFEDDDG